MTLAVLVILILRFVFAWEQDWVAVLVVESLSSITIALILIILALHNLFIFGQSGCEMLLKLKVDIRFKLSELTVPFLSFQRLIHIVIISCFTIEYYNLLIL